jgi:hypothetical protein
MRVGASVVIFTGGVGRLDGYSSRVDSIPRRRRRRRKRQREGRRAERERERERAKAKEVEREREQSVCCNSAHSTRPTRAFTQRIRYRRARSRRRLNPSDSILDCPNVPTPLYLQARPNASAAARLRAPILPTPLSFGLGPTPFLFHPCPRSVCIIVYLCPPLTLLM